MINSTPLSRVWGSALVCLALCCFSILAFAQERQSDPPNEDTTSEDQSSTLEFQKPDKIIIKERKAKGKHEFSHTVQQRSGTTAETTDGSVDVDDTVTTSTITFTGLESQQAGPENPPVKSKDPKPQPRAGGYVKLGDIKGEATDSEHKDWIIIESMSSPLAGKAGVKLRAPETSPRYECGQEGGECHCTGVLDCKNLWSSGDCKANTEWEDGNDNSKGGCIED
jgi:hypothetical protein